MDLKKIQINWTTQQQTLLKVCGSSVQGGAKAGLQLWLRETEFILVLSFINYCVVSHTNNCQATSAPPGDRFILCTQTMTGKQDLQRTFAQKRETVQKAQAAPLLVRWRTWPYLSGLGAAYAHIKGGSIMQTLRIGFLGWSDIIAHHQLVTHPKVASTLFARTREEEPAHWACACEARCLAQGCLSLPCGNRWALWQASCRIS